MFIGILIPITFFIVSAIILWKFFEGRHKERIAMIEKGLKPNEFDGGAPLNTNHNKVLNNLKWGLLFIFLGIGLLIGYQLNHLFGFDDRVAIFGSMFIAGGFALTIFYFIASKKLKEKKPDE